MTFGKFKSMVEKNLIESYKNENDFKKNLREFRHNILSDRSISRAYSIYDQLSTPQNLDEKSAKDFLEEGIDLLLRILPSIKLPKNLSENAVNNYEDIDVLVYNNKINLHERLESRKNLVQILMKDKSLQKESINIPLKAMVNVANQTLRTYVDNLDEESKKEFFQLINEDSKSLEEKFEKMKTDAIAKLNTLLEEEKETELKSRISETIVKLKEEKFDQLNFLRIKNLTSSI